MAADDCPYDLSQAQKFHQLANKVITLNVIQDDDSKEEINQLLDQFNALDFSLELVEKEEAERLLCRMMQIVPYEHDPLMAKFCQLMANVINKQQIGVGQECLAALLEYLIGSLGHAQECYYIDILIALGAAMYETNIRLEEYWDCLIGCEGILTKLASSEVVEIRKAALKCLENFTMRCPGEAYITQPYTETCFKIFLQVLQTSASGQDEIFHCRVLISALKALQNLITNSRTLHRNHIGELLAALKVLLFYGLPGSTLQQGSHCLYPAAVGSCDPWSQPHKDSEAANTGKDSHKRSKLKTKQKKGWQNAPDQRSKDDVLTSEDPLSSIWTPTSSQGGSFSSHTCSWAKMSSSESEYSDAENGQLVKHRSFQTRVRIYAQAVLLITVKNTERRVLYGYLPAFLPSSDTMPSWSLLTCIAKDPSPKVRTGVLAIIMCMLDGSKQFWGQADDSQKQNRSFTSFSKNLAAMIAELHRCLLSSLTVECSPLIITQLLKCLSTLVSNVPYQKLSPGLLTKVMVRLKMLLKYRESNVRVACLTCLGAILSIQPPLVEVVRLLLDDNSARLSEALDEHLQMQSLDETSDPDSRMDMHQMFSLMIGQHGTSELESWLVKLCRENVFPTASFTNDRNGGVPLPVRIESLQVLAALSKNYFFTIRSSIGDLTNLVHECLLDCESSVMLHGTRLFEQMGQAMLHELEKGSVVDDPLYSSGYIPISVEEAVSIWLRLLDGPLPAVLQNELQPVLRATGCVCLASIGAQSFELLSVDHRNLCMQLLLECINNTDNNVKGEAVRALGVYVLFPCLREDVCFLADAANAILTLMDDQNLIVRIKACWALGNLSDSFVQNRLEGSGTFAEEFSDLLLRKLCIIAIIAAQDNDKVRSNAVRAIGNLLRFLKEKTIAKGGFTEIVSQSVQALVKNISLGTNVKVHWNACYAVGNMFRNEAIPFEKSDWLIYVLTTLTTTIKECKNFKVRINAALALMVPNRRSIYGSIGQFSSLWSDVAEGLGTGHNVIDFTEYNYRDNLTNQLCGLLCHLATLIEPDDVPEIKIVLSDNDHVTVMMEKFKKSDHVDKDELTTAALKHLEMLKADQVEDLDFLLNLFSPINFD